MCPAFPTPSPLPPLRQMAGRVVVATPQFGVPGKVFGGAPIPGLGQGWAPNHTHPFQISVATNPAGIFLISGCCAGGYGKSTTYEYQGTMGDGVSASLPLFLVQACVAAS